MSLTEDNNLRMGLNGYGGSSKDRPDGTCRTGAYTAFTVHVLFPAGGRRRRPQEGRALRLFARSPAQGVRCAVRSLSVVGEAASGARTADRALRRLPG